MPIEKIPLHTFTEKAIKEYIKETISERAIADLKDGLKPVQRKILWTMFKLGLFSNLSYKKSARVVGETMGKYHPHGDSGIYQAMVNMAQANKKYYLIDGQGNWGSYSGDSAAASRYTECRLSKLSEIALLDKSYLKVIPYTENFDGTEQEPVYLPARLPFILLNGIQGIATATRTGLPSFEMKSLIDTCLYFLKYKELPLNKINLEFATIYGGKCSSSKDEINNLLGTGSGSILFEPNWTIYKDRIEITGIQDNFDFQKTIEKLEELQEVKSVRDEGTSGIKIVIYLNCKYNDEKAIEKIKKVIQSRILYNITILNRKLDSENIVHANYRETNIIKIIQNWCKFRVSLEKDYLTHLIQEKETEITSQQLLLKACSNIKIIFKLLQEEDNLEEKLIEKLNLINEDAKIILDLPIKRLSKLDKNKTEELLKKLKEELIELQKRLSNPVKEVEKDLIKLKKQFGE